MPDKQSEVTVELYDSRGRITASLTHAIDPADILIRPASGRAECRDIYIGGSSDRCSDVAIVAEGYTASESDLFHKDASETVRAIFSHEPFRSMKERFNFRAVMLESAQSGVSVPGGGDWKDTPLHSSFDTFYSSRYLTTLHLKDLHDALAGVPYEHIIILANTSTYGGGGIHNSYALTAAHHQQFRPVVVHEFGHSFAGLADEYYYDAVIWAVNHNPQITNGTSATEFSPNATCTRGQVVTFLWRANGCPEPKISINPFTDVKADAYYYKAVLWAIEEGITNGTSKTTFSPNEPCTRAHVVTFLWRSAGKPAAGSANPFTDVKAGQYYTDAVLWAVSKNITNGTSANTFSPGSPCTRGQIVTFLYRYMK